MIGNQSIDCKVKQPFRCNGKDYNVDDIFTLRLFNPLEKGYFNIGFVEEFAVEDYVYEVVNNEYFKSKVNIGDILTSDEAKDLADDMSVFVRLGHVNKVLKLNISDKQTEQNIDGNKLPQGTKPCNAHKKLGIKYHEFLDILRTLGYDKISLNTPMEDEILEKVNEYLSK